MPREDSFSPIGLRLLDLGFDSTSVEHAIRKRRRVPANGCLAVMVYCHGKLVVVKRGYGRWLCTGCGSWLNWYVP